MIIGNGFGGEEHLKKLETFRITQALIISSYVYSIVTEIAGDVDTTPVVVSGNSTVQ